MESGREGERDGGKGIKREKEGKLEGGEECERGGGKKRHREGEGELGGESV